MTISPPLPFQTGTSSRTFAAFHEEVTGHPPFPWQSDLAERLARGNVPGSLDAPTGFGKTTIVVCWAWALASQGHGEHPRSLPTRLVPVAPRRLIVDGTHDLAVKVAAAVANPSGPAATWVAEGLRRVAFPQGAWGPEVNPLNAVRVRGGTADDPNWVRRLDVPTVISCTPQQVGSAVLFRAYLASPAGRPMHAAAMAVDSLIVIDEAHLCAPLIETLESALAVQSAAPIQVQRPTIVLPMSATVRPAAGRIPMKVEPDAQGSSLAALQRRLVRRRVAVHQLSEGKPDLAKRLADLAKTAAESHHTVLVAVNDVETARRVKNKLAKSAKKTIVELVIGPQRTPDRDEIVSRLDSLVRPGPRPRTTAPVIVVATQALEVGADYDFDHVVTESCALDALLQRIGRLDRIGAYTATGATPTVDVVHSDSVDDDHPLYGDRARRTFDMLVVASFVAAFGGPPVDLGPSTLPTLLESAGGVDDKVQPSPEAPPLTHAVLDALVRTNPAPDPDPDVAPFISGVAAPRREVSVAWRDDLNNLALFADTNDTTTRAERTLHLRPIREHEAIAVPIAAVSEWLSGRTKSAASFGDDLHADDSSTSPFNFDAVPAVLVRHGKPAGIVSAKNRPRPGDVVVVGTNSGGYDHGWAPASKNPVEDVADMVTAGKPTRVHLPDAPDPASTDDPPTAVSDALAAAAASRAAAAELIGADRVTWNQHPGGGIVVRSLRRSLPPGTSGSEDRSSFSAPQSLDDHNAEVAARVADVVAALNLPDNVSVGLSAGAGRHDVGKIDWYWQAWACGGTAPDEPVAKSGLRPDPATRRRLYAEVGLDPAYRHEAVSAVVAAHGISDPVAADVAAWVAGTHHGHGRPFFPAADHPHEVTVTVDGKELTVNGSPYQKGVPTEWLLLFQRMNVRFGPWGTAYLETIVRAADWECSAEHEMRHA